MEMKISEWNKDMKYLILATKMGCSSSAIDSSLVKCRLEG